MCLLNEDQSWNLLRQKIFNRDPCPPKLEYMGKMIARSCRGLPLAIEVISGILAADQTQAAWEDIAENVLTAINCEDNGHILRELHLSYAYLPHHLRPCFLYLGMFPEDQETRVSKLIKLWVAEGFMNESECKSLEETAEEHLVDLIKRRLVSISKFDSRIKRVSVHDLIREVCIREARVDNFFHLVAGDAIKLARRVSIYDFHKNNVYGSTIRTIIYLGAGMKCSLRDFRLLRILDFFDDDKDKVDLPEQVSELFHLRYFAFDYPFSIPAAIPISNLQNLQTLIIRPRIDDICVVELPVEIWRMPQLRHVVEHSCVIPIQKEAEAAPLALLNLQTLTQAVNLICSRETLKRIPNLKKLRILYHLELEDDLQLHNLMYLQKLEILKITDLFSKCTRIHYLQKLTLPLSIKELTLAMREDFDWENVLENIGSLPLLQKLELAFGSFRAGKWEMVRGQFPCLKSLTLVGCRDLRYWTTEEFSVFPRLEQLRLYFLQQLEEIPMEIGEIPSLQKIELFHCSESAVKSARNIVDEQEELQGEISFHVLVVVGTDMDMNMRSLATTNFQVEVR